MGRQLWIQHIVDVLFELARRNYQAAVAQASEIVVVRMQAVKFRVIQRCGKGVWLKFVYRYLAAELGTATQPWTGAFARGKPCR